MPPADPNLFAQVFGRRSDVWTNRATDLLDRVRQPYRFVDLDAREHSALTAELIRETRHHQTPYVFVRGVFVGGFAELDERERLGQLVDEPARRPGRTEVVIAGRETEFVAPALHMGPRHRPTEE
ncbi:MAG: glutaredoxin [Myxococcales bacterium]|nr:glutaredoxin [Myxococcales bacterium]